MLIIIDAFIFLMDRPLPLLRKRGAGLGTALRQKNEYVSLNRLGPGTLQCRLQLADACIQVFHHDGWQGTLFPAHVGASVPPTEAPKDVYNKKTGSQGGFCSVFLWKAGRWRTSENQGQWWGN